MDDNSNLGIGNISENGRNAYDLHQVIRYRLALDGIKPEMLTFDFSPPTQRGSQPLAQIERLEQET